MSISVTIVAQWNCETVKEAIDIMEEVTRDIYDYANKGIQSITTSVGGNQKTVIKT